MIAIYTVEALFVLLIVFNYRACAKGWIWTTVGSDGVIAVMGFTLIRWIGETDNTWASCAAYTLGAMSGALGGMVLTRHWKGV